MTKVHFPNVNSLRFFAASCVIFYHLVVYQTIFKKEITVWYEPLANYLSHIAVSTFFVLSSFLITYLLLQEKAKTGTINIKYFYIRRICRIWPLYYLILLVSFFIIPHFNLLPLVGYPDKYIHNLYYILFFSVFLLPIITFKVICPDMLLAGPSWTLGVEEPYYLLWPWLVKRSQNLLRTMILMAAFCVLVKIILGTGAYFSKNSTVNFVHGLWNISTVTSFPIGGIAAWLYFNQKKAVLNIVYHIYFRIAIYVFTLILIFNNALFPFFYEFYSIVFAVLILNMATNKNTMLNLDNRILNYLGKISYGYYMYHVIVIGFVFKYIKGFNDITLYIIVYAATTLIAIASYEIIEKRFLKAKIRFAVIPSTDSVNEGNIVI